MLFSHGVSSGLGMLSRPFFLLSLWVCILPEGPQLYRGLTPEGIYPPGLWLVARLLSPCSVLPPAPRGAQPATAHSSLTEPAPPCLQSWPGWDSVHPVIFPSRPLFLLSLVGKKSCTFSVCFPLGAMCGLPLGSTARNTV